MSLEMILRARKGGFKPKAVVVVFGKPSPMDAPWDWVFFESKKKLIDADLRPLYRCDVYFHGEAWPEISAIVEEKEAGFIGHERLKNKHKQSEEWAIMAHEYMRDMTWKS